MPEVVEAAVIGVPDEFWGEAIKAFVVTAQPGRAHGRRRARALPEAAAQLQSARSMSSSCPRLPKTSNGKVAKEVLRSFARLTVVPIESRMQPTTAIDEQVDALIRGPQYAHAAGREGCRC